MHSFTYAYQIGQGQFYQQVLRRLAFLKAKLLRDLQECEKIFVYKCRNGLAESELMVLWDAMTTYGEPFLLCVRLADETRPAGTIETPEPGLTIGYISRFGYADGFADAAFDEWFDICSRVYARRSAVRARTVAPFVGEVPTSAAVAGE